MGLPLTPGETMQLLLVPLFVAAAAAAYYLFGPAWCGLFALLNASAKGVSDGD